MISVEIARKLILKSTKQLSPSRVGIVDSFGKVLSENVFSPISLPPFDQSAMDGFALKISEHSQKTKMKIIGEVAAGDIFQKTISAGQAVRIFTGAPVPRGANAVIMQEKSSIENGGLILNDINIRLGSNIRKAGSQIKKGSKAFSKGTIIAPGGIGYLTAMGVTHVNVISAPRITIIVTGSELKKAGKPLSNGEIYESNSFALEAALSSMHLKANKIISVRDNEKLVFATIKKAIANSDMVLVTGGISVGDYDFVGTSLKKLGVKNIFYKIKQKPGKPLFFGKYKNSLIFGLPGNPAAVLSCFYEYVYTAIKLMQGRKDVFLKKDFLPISKDYTKKKGLSFFLKGKMAENSVTPLEGQESYILSSFAIADSLIYLPEECEGVKSGDLVEVHILPYF